MAGVVAGVATGYRLAPRLHRLRVQRRSTAPEDAALSQLDAPHRPSSTKGKPPNIVFIVLDTTRADHMSYAGYPLATTPNIDRLAAESVTYDHAHSVAPWTLPSHMSMLTGLLPGEHGATWHAFDYAKDASLAEILSHRFELKDPSRLLGVRLHDLGYRCYGFSSNTWVSSRTGMAEGFDRFYEMDRERPALKRSYARLPPRLKTSRDADFGAAGLELLRFREHVADLGGDLPEPFFLFFNFIDPHYPYKAPRAWRYIFGADRSIESKMIDELSLVGGVRPFDIKRLVPFYDAELNYLDFVVGRMMTWLKIKGYFDNALIIVTADHGEHLGERGLFSHQFSVAEELLHVPLIVKYPGGKGAGTHVDNPLVSNLDVYETILSAARQGKAPSRPTRSRDLADMKAFHRQYLIAEYYYSDAYLRQIDAMSPEERKKNRVVRRVVFDRAGRRYVFVDEPGQGTIGDPRRAAAREYLRRYLSSLKPGGLHAIAAPPDEESVKELRALGYVK